MWEKIQEQQSPEGELFFSDPLSAPSWAISEKLTPSHPSNPKTLSPHPKIAYCQNLCYDACGINIDSDANPWALKLLKGCFDAMLIKNAEILASLADLTKEQIIEFTKCIIKNIPEILKSALQSIPWALSSLLSKDPYRAWEALASFIPTGKVFSLALAPVAVFMKTTGKSLRGMVNTELRDATLREMMKGRDWVRQILTDIKSWVLWSNFGTLEHTISQIGAMEWRALDTYIQNTIIQIAKNPEDKTELLALKKFAELTRSIHSAKYTVH